MFLTTKFKLKQLLNFHYYHMMMTPFFASMTLPCVMTETNQNSFVVVVVEISKFLLFVFSCISQNFERRFEKIELTLEIVNQEKDDHRQSAFQ